MSNRYDRRPAGLRGLGLLIGVCISLALPSVTNAQSTGSIAGRVLAETGEALSGARISVEPGGSGAITDPVGAFRLTQVPAGPVRVTAARIGYQTITREMTVAAGAVANVEITLPEAALELGGIVVSVSREAQRISETPATVDVVGGEQIRATGAAHPSEIMRQVPGAWVNVTAGEGHQTAIRQPLTTSPVYLYLQDGVPTRSTGFFNHNALYEINLPQADRVEVIKGPTTALYGSDAIGGIINVGTRAPGAEAAIEGSVEGGSHGWRRLLVSATGRGPSDGIRAEANVTRSTGWRDATGYDRQSGTLRWDRTLGAGSFQTVASFSRIDQGTAGSSALDAEDYRSDPTANYTPISFRKVNAFRLSSEYSRIAGNTLWTVTPFVRWNEMELIPNWALRYDPTVYSTGHSSAGALAKVRRDFEPLRMRAIVGVDVDYSPGFREESRIQAQRQGKVFTSYEDGERIYDYDVTYRSVSPYLQTELSPAERLRVVAGLRMDAIGFDYESHLDPIQTGRHRRPADTSVSYVHWSPKIGAAYEFGPALNVFVNYGHGFRAPSEGQLFRQGQALNTVDLKPVKVDSYETGMRGWFGDRFNFEVAAYTMSKRDDILNFTNIDGSTETVNAGRTLHRGIELGVGARLLPDIRLDATYSRAEHTYEDWADVGLSGKEMETAPNTLAGATLTYEPSFFEGSRFGVEWTHVGSYWMDAENTHRYPGHALFNLRIAAPVAEGISVFGRVMNLGDRRFAESAGYTVARGEEYAPGMPRTIYIGLQRN